VAFAQTDQAAPAASDVRGLLESPDTTQQAWGAYWAGRLLMVDSADEVEEMAKRLLDDSGWPRRVALDIAVDALIELDATPAPQFVAKLRRVQPAQALILLARLGDEANPMLLSMLSDANGYEWRAAANLLFARKAHGFAARLLSPLVFTAHLTVSRDGSIGVGSGMVGITIGHGAGAVAPGYPPWTGYALRDCHQSGDVVVAPGPKPVCVTRQRTTAGSTGFIPTHLPSGPTDEDRLAYFESVLPGIEVVERDAVAWKDQEQLAADMARLVGVIREKHRTLLDRLQQRGWLTEEEAALLANPTIREVVVDRRPK